MRPLAIGIVLFAFATRVFGADALPEPQRFSDDPRARAIAAAALSAPAVEPIAGVYRSPGSTYWFSRDGGFISETIAGCSQGVFLTAQVGTWTRDGDWLVLKVRADNDGGWVSGRPEVTASSATFRLLMIARGAERFLASEHEVAELAALLESYGRFQPGHFYHRADNADPEAQPRLEDMPAAFTALAHDGPIEAKVTEVVEGADLGDGRLHDESEMLRLRIDRGSADGLRAGTRLFAADPRQRADGKLDADEIGEHESEITVFANRFDAAGELPGVGFVFTTRAPSTRDDVPRAAVEVLGVEAASVDEPAGFAQFEYRDLEVRLRTGAQLAAGDLLWPAPGVADGLGRVLAVAGDRATVRYRADEKTWPRPGDELRSAETIDPESLRWR